MRRYGIRTSNHLNNQEALDLDPPAQTRAADEDELAADFERFLQTGEA